MNSLTEKLTHAIEELEADIAADAFEINRSRAAHDEARAAAYAHGLIEKSIRLQVFRQVAAWTVQAAPSPSGRLAMAAAAQIV